MFKLTSRSIENLTGVHEDLIKVVKYAITISEVEFIVTEVVRGRAKQLALVTAGASRTVNSRHLTGHAVDLAAVINSEVRWDWPLYHKIYDAMNTAAIKINVPLEWGGNWKKFKDGPHYQLPRKIYP